MLILSIVTSLFFFDPCASAESQHHESFTDFPFNSKYTGVIFDDHVSFNDWLVENPYDELELLPMIEKIQSRFAKILINVEHLDTELGVCTFPIVSATARYNQMANKTGKQLMETYILETWPTLDSGFVKLKCLHQMISQTNSRFRGTISMVLFEYDPNNFDFGYRLSEAQKMFHNSSVQLGIYLDAMNIAAFISEKREHEFPSTDLFFLRVMPQFSEHEVSDAFLNTSKFCLHKFEIAKRSLQESYSRQGLKFGFLTGWPDTNNYGDKNYSSLARFWKALSHWGEHHETLVIFDRAFDTPGLEPMESTLGWWRLVENSSYNSTSDYVFQEKYLMGDQQASSKLLDLMRTPTYKFSTSSVVVWPKLTTDKNIFPGEINPSNLLPEASALFQLTRNILVDVTDVVADSSDDIGTHKVLNMIPQTTAMYNDKLNRTCDKFAPSEVTIRIPVYTSTHLDDQISFMLRTFNASNSIFPGTVSTCVIDFEEDLQPKDKIFLPEVDGLEFGVVQNLRYCLGKIGSKNFRKFIQPFLQSSSSIRTIYLKHILHPTMLPADTSTIFDQVTVAVELCRKKIKKLSFDSDEVKVGIITGWGLSLNGSNIDAVTKLGKYMEMISNWANRTNINVIFHHAFSFAVSSRGISYGLRDAGLNLLKGLEHDTKDAKNGISRKGLYPESQSGSNCETLQEVQPLYMLHPTTKLPTTSPLKRGKEIPLNGHTTPFPVVAGHNQLVYAIAGLSMVVACWMLCILYSIVKTRKIEGACETRSLIKNQETQHTSCSDIDALEVPSFNFEKEAIGSGQFGQVYRGWISRSFNNTNKVNVALKMRNISDKLGVDNILSQIEIMFRAGKHENVVSLMGIHNFSRQKNKEKIYMFMDLCEIGSLHDYLRNLNPNKYNDLLSCEIMGQELLTQLRQWLQGILNGMGYLASKHIVHGNLAAKNVLLTAEKEVKISNFGLSRQMNHYRQHKQKNVDVAPPWKWMAPESLSFNELCYTEKSDVWAFGVTIWELYTFGRAPYAGLDFDESFLIKLEHGLRPRKPDYCQNFSYQIMQKCWSFKASNRPTFSELQEFVKISIFGNMTRTPQTQDKRTNTENTYQKYKSHSLKIWLQYLCYNCGRLLLGDVDTNEGELKGLEYLNLEMMKKRKGSTQKKIPVCTVRPNGAVVYVKPESSVISENNLSLRQSEFIDCEDFRRRFCSQCSNLKY